MKAVHHILLSRTETKGAFKIGFDRVNLHRPTEGEVGGGGEGFGGGGAGGNSITTASSAVATAAVNTVVSDITASVDKPVLLVLVLSVSLVLFVMLTGLEAALMASRQGLTLVHCSAQRKHFWGEELLSFSVSVTKTAQVEQKSGRV